MPRMFLKMTSEVLQKLLATQVVQSYVYVIERV